MKSESIGNLAKALSQAQSEMKAAEMNAKNPFLKNKYADLGSIIASVREPLAKHNLSFVQMVLGEGDMVGVETILMHESGEWVSSDVFLPIGTEKGKSQAQVAGSIITYLRRYSLASILGVYADEDTDGNAPNGQKADPGSVEAPRPAKPNGNGAVMSLETAQAITNSKGKKYGDMTTEELSNMSTYIARALNGDKAKNNHAHREELLLKQAAIGVLLQAA